LLSYFFFSYSSFFFASDFREIWRIDDNHLLEIIRIILKLATITWVLIYHDIMQTGTYLLLGTLWSDYGALGYGLARTGSAEAALSV
jgi:hypothetical protein